jgi:hypothetical protein
MALKAFNLEKFVGADKAGRGVVVPKDGAPPEEWKAYFAKAGMPDKPDGYKLPDGLDAAKDPLLNKFREFAHGKGIPAPMFDAVMEFYAKDIVAAASGLDEQSRAEFERQAEKEWGQLQQEWQGKDQNGVPIYDKNIEVARRAAKQFIPHNAPEELEATLLKIEGALGPKAMMQLFANIGNSIGEHGYVGGEGSGGGGPSTPESARVRIAELKADQGFVAKFTAGDADSKAEWDRLHKIAYSKSA